MIKSNDRLPIWWLMKACDMPRHQVTPLIHDLGLPVEFDQESGEVYSSRSDFAEMLRSIAEGAR